ncbi:CHAP domain-containing protein [Phyllobacterium sp. LjRoot231]|uniref:CHAP domain-containing protein n=1 Tax=Phyllobacterium sp. LjRoot231 TaxID=3342289 RepID=UPI003F50923E
MITRRGVVVGSLVSAALLSRCASGSGFSSRDAKGTIKTSESGFVVLGPDYVSDVVPTFDSLSTLRKGERQKAKAILNGAPTSSPAAVMGYFRDLRAKNDLGEAYNAGWYGRWNPVLLAFFDATDTKPTQDNTPWCAAFLNWSLARCRYKGGTRSSSSGTFRNVGGVTTRPSRGDVVVFKQPGTSCQGHVGLYVRITSSEILVLGGNQEFEGHHSVNEKVVPAPGSPLRFHSYHRISALKDPVSPLPTC